MTSDDIQSLVRDVGQLRLQVETLQQENEQLKKQMLTSADVKTMVQNTVAASRADIKNKDTAPAIADARKEILAEVAKQIEKLGEDTNTQLQKLAKAIGTAPPAKLSAPTISTPVDPSKFGNGQIYTVVKGDNLSKIVAKLATQQGIHVSQADIKAANNLPADGSVKTGQNLFIPVKDGAPAPSAPPAPSGVTSAPAN